MRAPGVEPGTSALSELRSSQLSYARVDCRQQKSQTRQRFGPIRPELWDRASTLLANVNDRVCHLDCPVAGTFRALVGEINRIIIIKPASGVSTGKNVFLVFRPSWGGFAFRLTGGKMPTNHRRKSAKLLQVPRCLR